MRLAPHSYVLQNRGSAEDTFGKLQEFDFVKKFCGWMDESPDHDEKDEVIFVKLAAVSIL